jgi:very-short-patch-repair endonuclease
MMKKNIIKGQAISSQKLALAKEFRRNSTLAEKILRQSLRAERLGDWHFRRQQILFGYIVDFYCHAASLIVEVDGEIHESQRIADQEREAILIEKGFQILRFRNLEIELDLNAVLTKILEACNQTLPIIPSPLSAQASVQKGGPSPLPAQVSDPTPLPAQRTDPSPLPLQGRGRGRGPKGT